MSPLVSAASLAQELTGSGPPVLLDLRWRLGGPPGANSYRAGHLPGAVYVDLDSDLCGAPGPEGRHPLPPAAGFQASMRRAGVRDGHPVVVYDNGDGMAASRAWWTLRYFGHEDVRVLDGGFLAWQAAKGGRQAGREITVAEPGVQPGDFTARPGGMPLLDAAGAATMTRKGILLDARAEERYRGDNEPVDPVAGHIPGAVNAPATGNVAEDGTFLPARRLRERFAALGVAGDGRPVGAYCGSGVTAAQLVLSLAIAGIPGALYVGSWSHWVTDPSRPVATGAEPG